MRKALFDSSSDDMIRLISHGMVSVKVMCRMQRSTVGRPGWLATNIDVLGTDWRFRDWQ
jgi:hypothetical protein